MSRILILKPDSVCEDSLGYSFFRASLVHRRLGAFKEIDATYTRGNPEQVNAEIMSGEYWVILVCDLSAKHHWWDNVMLNWFTLWNLNQILLT